MNIGDYELKAELRKDAIYRWVDAVDRNQGNRVFLQIVQPDTRKEEIDAILSYFDKLQLIRRKGLWIPEQMFADENFPLVLVYSYINADPLIDVLKKTPKEALKWWHQASERLHTLHNKDLVHGCITLDSFAIASNDLYLTNFGYAPLLQLGEREVLREYESLLAPEVLEQHRVTKAIDVYAFAETVGNWEPKLKTTQWYSQATDTSPDNRYQRMRNLFDVLKKAFASLEDKPANPPGGIIPKYVLEVREEPTQAGKVDGGGNYPANKIVSIEAIPSPGWKFEGWSGELSGLENPTTLKMDGDKTVVAQFAKVPKEQSFILKVSAEPKEAGAVSGGGSYETDTLVQVEAKPSSLWLFERWSGDLKGSKNPEQLVIDAHKSVVAHFSRKPSQESSIPSWARSTNA